jgi:hypothetical protein
VPTYTNCIRLNYSGAWSAEMEAAVITLGKLVATLQEREAT